MSSELNASSGAFSVDADGRHGATTTNRVNEKIAKGEPLMISHKLDDESSCPGVSPEIVGYFTTIRTRVWSCSDE